MQVFFTGVRSGAKVYSDGAPIRLPSSPWGPQARICPQAIPQPRCHRGRWRLLATFLQPALHTMRTDDQGFFIEHSRQARDPWGLQLIWEVRWVLSPHGPFPGAATQRGEGPPGAGQLPALPLLRVSPLAPDSVCSWPPPGPLGEWPQAAGSELVTGTVLQGLLQGMDHPVHVLLGGVAAQQADPKHLPGVGGGTMQLSAQP